MAKRHGRVRKVVVGVVIASTAVVGLAGTAEARPRPQPAQPPAWATAKCKNGSFSSSRVRSVACRGQGGVSAWYRILGLS